MGQPQQYQGANLAQVQARGACVAPACTCVPQDAAPIRHLRAPGDSSISLTQLRGLGRLCVPVLVLVLVLVLLLIDG